MRFGKNTRRSRGAQLRRSVYSKLAGYEDTNDPERLSVDPAMRHVVDGPAMKKIALDMESSASEIYGRQEGTAYN